MISTLAEGALRSLLLAAAVWAGLRAFRVRNVVAAKAAWALVLAAAILMPALVPMVSRWQFLPAGVKVVLPAHPMTLLEELRATLESRRPMSGPATKTATAAPPAAAPHAFTPQIEEPAQQAPEPAGTDATPSQEDSSAYWQAPDASSAPPVAARSMIPSTAALAAGLYPAVALVLLGRMLLGLVTALRLWHAATPVAAGSAFDVPVRASKGILSPVTIGSGVLLPADYAEWDEEKLRVVLAHERSHVQQRDFYLQLVAGLYAAAFWISPLGWWLKRKLSDLAEAISDGAALGEAAGRPAYARILLEFAAAPRPTVIGVAMARSSRISHRIERLLNENLFHQAFESTRRRAVLAVLLVPVALFAVAAIRVQAAQEPVAPAAPMPPAAVPAPPAAPSAAPTPEPRDGIAAPEPDENITVPAPMPAPQALPAPPAPPLPPDHLVDGDEPFVWNSGEGDKVMYHRNGFAVRRDDNGDSYIVVHDRGSVSVDGKAENDALQKARKMAKGDFVLYTHAGKSYIIDDPATVAQIDAAMGPTHLLQFKAKMLADKDLHMAEIQRQIAAQQKEFAKQQKVIILRQKELMEKQKLTAPELKKQMQELNETVAKLEARKDQQLSNEDLAELRSEVAQLQAKLSGFPMHFELQNIEIPKIEIPKIEIDKQMADFQRQVAEAQKRAQQESDQKMKSIIDQSLKDGKAKPVE